MEFTGERYLPEVVSPYIAYEHWHRYLFASGWVAGKDVLDVASGEGYGSRWLARSARTVLGVDIDPAAVAHAAAAYPADNLTFRCGSAAAIPVEGRHRFDVIVSFETLEHLPAAGQAAFLAEAARLLRPGGVLLLSTPNRDAYNARNGEANEFHLLELDEAEFRNYLRPSFPHVTMYAQRVYPASVIWDTAGGSGAWTDYQIGTASGRAEPTPSDRREKLYLLAACSDRPLPAVGGSVMVDVDETLLGGSAPAAGPATTLYLDRGAGFTEADVVRTTVPAAGEFDLSFAVLPGAPVRAVRWDPVERRLCRVKLTDAAWTDPAGGRHPFDPAGLESNGRPAGDGGLAFETLDPRILIPAPGPVAGLTLRGEIEAETEAASADALDAALAAVRADVSNLELWTTLFCDAGRGYLEEDAVRRHVDPSAERFDFRFPVLPGATTARWDPVERRLCRVELAEVVAVRADGTESAVSTHGLAGNGDPDGPGAYRFANLDPYLFFPVPPGAVELTVRGWWEVADVNATLDRLGGAVAAVAQVRSEYAGLAARAAVLDLTTTLYYDAGRGYSEDFTVRHPADGGAGRFAFRFDLPPGVVAARWDPVERRLCRVAFDELTAVGADGAETPLPADGLAGNGHPDGPGAYRFQSLDPMLFLPVPPGAAAVVVRGRWEVAGVNATLDRLAGRVQELEAALWSARRAA